MLEEKLSNARGARWNVEKSLSWWKQRGAKAAPGVRGALTRDNCSTAEKGSDVREGFISQDWLAYYTAEEIEAFLRHLLH